MERTTRAPRPQLKRTASQGNTQNGKPVPMRKLSFRSVARRVLIANSFTRRQTVTTTLSTGSASSKWLSENNISTTRPPSVKRRGTPEIFPMSPEMIKTLLLLGKMDLVPEEEKAKQRAQRAAEVSAAKGGKFRQKTRMRIIHPQRFIRNVQSSIASAGEKCSSIEEEDPSFHVGKNGESSSKSAFEQIDSVVKEDHTNSASGSSHTIELESISNEEVDYSNLRNTPMQIQHMEKRSSVLNSRTFNPRVMQVGDSHQRTSRLAKTYPESLRKSDSRRQKDASNGTSKRKRLHYGSSGQFSSKDGRSEDDSETSDAIEHWKSIEALTNDIQNRCSRWFEFRRNLLSQ